MNVALVVVTYNGVSWIRKVLDSVAASNYPCKAIVVDNASNDETALIIENEYSAVHLIRSEENVGFGRGNNLGIAYALQNGADFVFLLNQDAYIFPDTIGTLVEFMVSHPDYGLASPLHCSPDEQQLDPTTQRAYFNRFAPQMLSDAVLGKLQPFYCLHGVNAAAWLLSRRCLDTVGGFDPLFFMYGEDDDFLLRVAYHNLRAAVVTGSRIVQFREKSPRPPAGYFRSIGIAAERIRSSLLLDLKRFDHAHHFKFQQLMINGIFRPILSAIEGRDINGLLASWLAVFKLLTEWRLVIKSVDRCKIPGPHFFFH